MSHRRHSFRDPIHGYIRVSDEERSHIDSQPFQRLRRIKQLGTGYLIYHGAEHSRFGHCLGVMEVATRMFRAVHDSKPDLMESSEDWERAEQLLRITALLHDVGHAPYSHASEELFPRDEHDSALEHEDYSAAIILESEIRELIDSGFSGVGITAQDVVDVYASSSPPQRVGVLIQDIVAGELDADRVDYLSRDSHYAGVSYGRFDLERLLDTITAIEDQHGVFHLAVEEDGRYALEEFLLARFYMFLQVYLHPYRRFYDLALTRTIRTLLKDQDGRYPSPNEVSEYLKFDDGWIDSSAQELIDAGDVWAKSLYSRSHWKCVVEHRRGTLDKRPEPTIDAAEWTDAVREVQKRFGENETILDPAQASNFHATEPGPYISGTSEEEERPKILIARRNGQAELVENVSKIVHELSQEPIKIRRLYASPEVEKDVSSELSKLLPRSR